MKKGQKGEENKSERNIGRRERVVGRFLFVDQLGSSLSGEVAVQKYFISFTDSVVLEVCELSRARGEERRLSSDHGRDASVRFPSVAEIEILISVEMRNIRVQVELG